MTRGIIFALFGAAGGCLLITLISLVAMVKTKSKDTYIPLLQTTARKAYLIYMTAGVAFLVIAILLYMLV